MANVLQDEAGILSAVCGSKLRDHTVNTVDRDKCLYFEIYKFSHSSSDFSSVGRALD